MLLAEQTSTTSSAAENIEMILCIGLTAFFEKSHSESYNHVFHETFFTLALSVHIRK